MYLNLKDETLFRLQKVSKIEDYFTIEIEESKAMSKRLNKNIVAFNCISKISIVSASFSHVCSLTAGIIKKLLKTTKI